MPMQSVWRRLARWRKDQRGAVAVLFAITFTALLALVALGIDVGFAVWARGQLDIAADAAALTAATKGANDYVAGNSTWETTGEEAGEKRFYAQADTIPGVQHATVSAPVRPKDAAISGVTAVATYTATYTPYFSDLFRLLPGAIDLSTIPINGSAAVTRLIRPYFELSIMMDASSSMAIGATQTDMDNLGNLVRKGPQFTTWGQSQNCAFGCHFSASGDDFYSLAHANNVTLRIDVVKQAISNLIQSITQSSSASQFQVGLYTFNQSFTTVSTPNSDLQAVATAAQNIAIPVTTDGGTPSTNLPLALQSLTSAIPASGNGWSTASPLRYVFILTDGVADYPGAKGRTMVPIDPADCAALKAKGVQILTLYTTYIPLTPPYVPQANAFYNANIAPFSNQIQPNMVACASSPSFAFEASDPSGIASALKAMLAAAQARPALFTQ
jgi:Flp pilus assembly protein TadG